MNVGGFIHHSQSHVCGLRKEENMFLMITGIRIGLTFCRFSKCEVISDRVVLVS
jgi:hypothetical protein